MNLFHFAKHCLQLHYKLLDKTEYIKLITPKSTFTCSFAGNPFSDRICICTGFPFPKVLFATFCNAAGEINSIFGQHCFGLKK